MKVTKEHLLRWQACTSHRDLFAQVFPDGAEMTVANLRAAEEAGLDLVWLRRILCGAIELRYDRCVTSACDAFHVTTDRLLVEHRTRCAVCRKQYAEEAAKLLEAHMHSQIDMSQYDARVLQLQQERHKVEAESVRLYYNDSASAYQVLQDARDGYFLDALRETVEKEDSVLCQSRS